MQNRLYIYYFERRSELYFFLYFRLATSEFCEQLYRPRGQMSPGTACHYNAVEIKFLKNRHKEYRYKCAQSAIGLNVCVCKMFFESGT